MIWYDTHHKIYNILLLLQINSISISKIVDYTKNLLFIISYRYIDEINDITNYCNIITCLISFLLLNEMK